MMGDHYGHHPYLFPLAVSSHESSIKQRIWKLSFMGGSSGGLPI